MKKELKISTISIVCVLCAAFSAPAFAAPAVRSLGGVGTYSSASNAASAKTSGATAGALNSVRGGSVRVGGSAAPATSASKVASTTRTAAVPRLSIGKYLAGNAVLGGTAGTGNGQAKPGQAAGNLQTRIEILEAWMGYKEDNPTLPDQFADLSVDIESLKADVKKLTDGAIVDVDYASGVLSVTKNLDGKEETVSYDLNKEFAGVNALAALEEKINQIVLDNYVTRDELAGYALRADLDSAVAQLTATDGQLQAAIDALREMGDVADAAELAAVKADVEKLLVSDKKNADDILALQTTVAALNSDNMIVKDAVQKLENSLGAFLTVEDLANYYTKDEVNALVDAAGNFDATQYYTKGETDTTFATQAALGDVSRLANLNAEEIEGLKQASGTHATQEQLAGVKTDLENQIQGITGGETLGALAYEDKITAADVDVSSVDGLAVGDMVIVKQTAQGPQFVSIEIIGPDGQKL